LDEPRRPAALTANGRAGCERARSPPAQRAQGDLPVLVVDAKGRAGKAVVAPHLEVADVKGQAIIIHAGGDNYADQPAPLGGGGARIACAVVK
jgi:Cu-Zn family superoxide dismutase